MSNNLQSTTTESASSNNLHNLSQNTTAAQLESLMTIFTAQTEAYMEFNSALVNILNNQTEIKNIVQSLKTISDTEFRSLDKNYHTLKELFLSFQNLQNAKDTALESAIEEYTAQISHFGAEFEKHKNDINKSFTESSSNIKIIAADREMNTEIKQIKEDIESIKHVYAKLLSVGSQIKWIAVVIFTLLTLYQLITGQGIINLFLRK